MRAKELSRREARALQRRGAAANGREHGAQAGRDPSVVLRLRVVHYSIKGTSRSKCPTCATVVARTS
ncbi:MAG: hypothetical protein FWG30_01105 [Eubacteriaceae bacterium]|nr:hypothetical protein [Eubacteriaceae bacterium]